jgi:hypothetical protein
MERELASKRCANHWQREAAARCPECGRFFCRECVTEHEDRILCAACVKNLVSGSKKTSTPVTVLFRTIQVLIAFFVLWIFFYSIGRTLLLLPDEFHEGTVWQEDE